MVPSQEFGNGTVSGGEQSRDSRDASVPALARFDFVREREGHAMGNKVEIGVTQAFRPLPASTLFGGGLFVVTPSGVCGWLGGWADDSSEFHTGFSILDSSPKA